MTDAERILRAALLVACDLAEQAGASQRELAVLREVEREAVVDHGVAVARVRTKRVPREHPATIASSATKCAGQSCPDRPPTIASRGDGAPACYTCGKSMKVLPPICAHGRPWDRCRECPENNKESIK